MKLESRQIQLHGPLSKICNGDTTVRVGGTSIAAIVSGLTFKYGDKVKKYFRENNWQLLVGDKKDKDIGENELYDVIDDDVIHFYPVIEGGGGRFGRIVLGAALITASFFVPGSGVITSAVSSALVSAGVGLILTGLFAPSAPESRERPDEQPSFLFNGATNTSTEGSGVPVVFGRTRTGSVTVSAGIDVEARAFDSPSDPSPGGPGGGGGGPVDPRVGLRLF